MQVAGQNSASTSSLLSTERLFRSEVYLNASLESPLEEKLKCASCVEDQLKIFAADVGLYTTVSFFVATVEMKRRIELRV